MPILKLPADNPAAPPAGGEREREEVRDRREEAERAPGDAVGRREEKGGVLGSVREGDFLRQAPEVVRSRSQLLHGLEVR